LNKGSLHPLNRARDVSIHGKTAEEIAEFFERAIKAGIRVVDERKKIPGVYQSAPHIHLEENDRRASYFDPKLDYAGRLEYLKALDKERLAEKGTKSLSASLDPADAERERKALADKLERERAARVKNRVETDARILELARTIHGQEIFFAHQIPVMHSAESIEDAAEIVRVHIFERLPETEGFYGYQAAITPITEDFYKAADDLRNAGVMDMSSNEESRCFSFDSELDSEFLS
jgi:hypothetical protein